uniref:Uncharacterized protein n=1 Tax=Opuntia streptacantha TaxID=393608 RepID=A0A7C9DC86_OPUST
MTNIMTLLLPRRRTSSLLYFSRWKTGCMKMGKMKPKVCMWRSLRSSKSEVIPLRNGTKSTWSGGLLSTNLPTASIVIEMQQCQKIPNLSILTLQRRRRSSILVWKQKHGSEIKSNNRMHFPNMQLLS